MKVIETDGMYRIFQNGVKVYDELPVKTYNLYCGQFTGMYLEETEDISIKEKIYGSHMSKVEKILKSFKSFDRNLGVILSGDKGIGKSICAKLLAQKCVEENIPVILVNRCFKGLASFISDIKQRVCVIFDEFDKTFDNEEDNQTDLLTLFDGFDQGQKLFVITCNNINSINEFLVNRPGRFHYHLRFEYPNSDEIKEYLTDKLDKEYYGEIDKVLKFAVKNGRVNYDCLRAIAFELNLGTKFEEAVKDLNIVKLSEGGEPYTITAVFSNGATAKRKYRMDLFFTDDEEATEYIEFGNENGLPGFEFNFDKTGIEYNEIDGTMTLDKEYITDFDWWTDEKKKLASLPKLEKLIIKGFGTKKIHYLL